jgi:hypothetical protein
MVLTLVGITMGWRIRRHHGRDADRQLLTADGAVPGVDAVPLDDQLDEVVRRRTRSGEARRGIVRDQPAGSVTEVGSLDPMAFVAVTLNL